MKRKVISLLMVLAMTGAVLTGCQTGKKDTSSKTAKTKSVKMSSSNQYIREEDGCNNYLDTGQTAVIVQDKNGYYFKREGLLCYYDRNSDKTMVVCSKPDCKHEPNDDTCDANMAEYGDNLFAYKNQLYATHLDGDDKGTTGIYLTQISPDGASRKDLFRLYKIIDGIWTECVYIHRGYLYYSSQDNQDESKKQKLTLYRRALVKDAPEEVFYETETYGGSIDMVRAYGNEIYFEESGFQKPEKEAYMSLMKCNIHTKKAEVVKDKFYGLYEKNGDNIYFFDKDKKKLERYSEKTKEITELCKVQQMPETDLKSDGQYLYLYCFGWKKDKKHKSKRLQVLDLEGKTVAVLEDTGEFIGADEDRLFFYSYDKDPADKRYTVKNYYYLKKSDLASEDYSKCKIMLPE